MDLMFFLHICWRGDRIANDLVLHEISAFGLIWEILFDQESVSNYDYKFHCNWYEAIYVINFLIDKYFPQIKTSD